MRRRLFYLIWVGLLLTSASAQEATIPPTEASTETQTPESTLPPEPTLSPEPTLPSSLLSAESDWLFPFGAVFAFRLDARPSEITSAVVSISQEGWPSQTRVAQPQTVSNLPRQTDISLIWEVPSSTPPTLFKPLVFTWLFTFTDERIITYTVAFDFSDPRYAWSVDDSADSAIHITSPKNAFSAPSILRVVSPLVERLRAQTGQSLSGLKIVFYDSLVPLNLCPPDGLAFGPNTETELACAPGILENLYAAQGYTLLRVSPLSISAALSTLTGYLVDTAYSSVWAGQTVPDWFRFGLKRFYDPATKTSEFGFAVNAARNGSLLSSLENPPTSGQSRALWEAEAAGWMLYMADQVGFEGVLDIAATINSQRNLADIYLQRTGSPLTSLSAGWRAWLFTDRARAAYDLLLYSPATATPTATATITLTPTLTHPPTVIPSRTPTPTPSHTPVYTPTASRTPTLTPTPTATITLRPRVSFTPSNVQSNGSSETAQSISDVITAIVLILGSIAAFGYVRRLNQR